MRLRALMGDGPFWRSALRLALPIALQNLLISSFTMVDTYMIGLLPDSGVLIAAVGMAGRLSWLMHLTLFGFSSGAAVFISQYWGVQDIRGIHRAYGLSLSCSVASAVLFTAVGLFFPEAVVRRFTDSAEYIDLAASYLRIASLSYLASAFQMTFSTVLRSTEEVKLPLYASAVGMVLNAALNALFIFGLGMGLRGAAIGTVISAWISPTLLFLASLKRRSLIIARLSALFDLPRAFVARYIKTALPVLLNEVLWGVGTMGYLAIFSRRSEDFFAALTIYGNIEGVMFVFFIGLCHACTVLVGKSVGAGDRIKAEMDARRFAFWVPALAFLVGLGVALGGGVFLLPMQLSTQLAGMARGVMRVAGLELALRCLCYIAIVGIFRAGGDTRTGLMYDIGCVWLIALPLTYLSANVWHMPLIAVYAVMLLAEDGIKCVLCLRRLASGRWYNPVTARSEAAYRPVKEAESEAV